MSSVFTNAKPRIFGTDTHALIVGGDDTHDVELVGDSSVQFGAKDFGAELIVDGVVSVDRSTPGPLDILGSIINVTTTDPNDIVLLTLSLAYNSFSDNAILRFRRNGVGIGDVIVINSITSTIKTDVIQTIDMPGSGTFTYDIQVIDDDGLFLVISNSLCGNIISNSDSHSAVLIGNNTQTAELVGENTQETRHGSVLE